MCSDCPTHLEVTDEDDEAFEDEGLFVPDEEE